MKVEKKEYFWTTKTNTIRKISTFFTAEMKQIIKSLFIIFFISCTYILSAQPIRHQINQSIDAAEADSVHFDLGEDVVFRKTPGSKILVEITIEMENGTASIMAVLARSNRYKLLTSNENRILSIAPPKDNPKIKIGTEEAKETITYKVYLPEKLW